MSRQLTPRERELVMRCSEPGATQEAVAESLGISVSTVRATLQLAYRRLGVESRDQALAAILASDSQARVDRTIARKPRMNLVLRFTILERDLFTCRYCGRKAPDVPLEVDHVLALANGGTNDPSNLITACYDCNHGKAARVLAS